ncbi:MAG: methyltransferase domain-containing protein [Anaerolineae bacterium]
MSNESSPTICDYEGSQYRTDFWEGRGREYEDLAERIALRRLLPAGGQRLLDIGAGFGRLADAYHGFKQVILLDYSRSQLEYARQRLGDERFLYVAADIYHLPLATNAVDTTVMVRVLHHLVDVPCALGQIARATTPQGAFVLEHANKRHLKNLVRYALHRGPNPFDRAPYAFAELHYDFHPAWVREQLNRAGFLPQTALSVSLFRSGLLKRLATPRLLAGADGLLQRVTAPLALGPSVFVRARVAKPGEAQVCDAASLFRCPACESEPLARCPQGLQCPECGRIWPIENGIYVFK